MPKPIAEIWREIHAERVKALEALLTICPVCENDFSGGGVDEPSTDCSNCNNLGFVAPAPVLSDEERERLLKLADVIGGVHRPCADPELHEDDARFLHNLASQENRQQWHCPKCGTSCQTKESTTEESMAAHSVARGHRHRDALG